MAKSFSVLPWNALQDRAHPAAPGILGKREDVALARKLHDLHSEVEEARKQVPKLPAIAAQFDAEQNRQGVQQVRLEQELAKTKDQLGKLRVSQSITDYELRELRKQARSAAGASIEMEFESRMPISR